MDGGIPAPSGSGSGEPSSFWVRVVGAMVVVNFLLLVSLSLYLFRTDPAAKATADSGPSFEYSRVQEYKNNAVMTDRVRRSLNESSDESFQKCRTMEATAYSGDFNGSSKTRMGIEPFYHAVARRGIVAVDPTEFVPLGSVIWIEGYGVAFAVDTGEDIKGNRIDVYYDTEYSARQWGRKDVEVCRLKGPGHHEQFGFPDPKNY